MTKNVLSAVFASIAAIFLIFCASVAAEGQTVLDTSREESSVRGIIFPVAELGGCANKNECKQYCNQPANMEACIAFAKDHGLMTETDAEQAEKFTKHVREGSGPGNCNSPDSCDQYCSNIANLDECTSFAEKNGFKDEHYEQGKKIQNFLKKGGTTPGNCQTKQECETYCGDFSHAKECFDFAQKSGIMQKGGRISGDPHEPNAEQLEKIMQLSESGQTPGGCTSKEMCEKYCSEASHREECLEFGVKIGFIKPDEAKRIKEMGGKGPGNCDSERSCHEYCNQESHREECFKFAQEHGFMTKEEAVQAKNGWVRARQGFENAPPEVRECLNTTLGETILADIQSGELVPGPDIGNSIRDCFEKFGGNMRPEEAMKNLPPEASACLKEKFGDTFEAIKSGKMEMTPEMADSFRVCFQNMHPEQGFININNNDNEEDLDGKSGNTMPKPRGGGIDADMPQGLQDMMRFAPPEVVACMKEKLGNVPPTAQIGAEIKEKIRGCFEGARQTDTAAYPKPPAGSGGTWTEEKMRNAEPVPNGYIAPPKPPASQANLMNMPPEVLKCLEESLGADGLAKLQSAPASPELVGAVKTCVEKTMQMRLERNQMEGGGYVAPNENESSEYPSQEVSPPQPYREPTNTTQPVTFLEKFIAAALLPLRWMLGK